MGRPVAFACAGAPTLCRWTKASFSPAGSSAWTGADFVLWTPTLFPGRITSSIQREAVKVAQGVRVTGWPYARWQLLHCKMFCVKNCPHEVIRAKIHAQGAKFALSWTWPEPTSPSTSLSCCSAEGVESLSVELWVSLLTYHAVNLSKWLTNPILCPV